MAADHNPYAKKEDLSTGRSLELIDRYGGKFGQKIVVGASVIQVVLPAYKWVKTRLNRRESFTISLSGEDDIYPYVHDWVLGQMPEEAQKALILDTKWDNDDLGSRVGEIDDGLGGRQRGGKATLRFDGSRVQEVMLDGHKIWAKVERDDFPGGREQIPANWRRLTEKVVLTSDTMEGRDAIIRKINDLLPRAYPPDRPPALMMPSRWSGQWQARDDLRPRSLESVVLKTGQEEELVSDLQTFLGSEDLYERLGQPWHRGYLFYGPPGTGKTSMARALSNHFEMPVYYLPLGDQQSDTNLLQLVSMIRPRSVLLIEDIDVYQAATKRSDDSHKKSSLASLLNALDGIWTPHGLVTMLTTNSKDVLDPALLRAGRVDVQEELTVLDLDQAQRLARVVGYDDPVDQFVGQAPADLIEAARHEHLEVRRRHDLIEVA